MKTSLALSPPSISIVVGSSPQAAEDVGGEEGLGREAEDNIDDLSGLKVVSLGDAVEVGVDAE